MSSRGGKKDIDEEYTPYDADNDSNALIVDGNKKKTKKVGPSYLVFTRRIFGDCVFYSLSPYLSHSRLHLALQALLYQKKFWSS